LRWYRHAAERGNVYGIFKLGWFAEKGLDQPVDHALAVSWYRKAAMRGYVIAQHNLGIHLRDGKGVAADPVEAMMWFELAAKQGNQYMIRSRDQFAEKIAPDQLDEARRRADSWKPES
jgi:TPR repeat protein